MKTYQNQRMMDKKEFDQAVERLQRPFALRDIEWVPSFTYPKDADKTYQNTVIGVAAYVRREAVITRFNVVCGAGEWENIIEPLGKFGLYQGVAINKEGEWVRKFDGAQMDDGDSGRIDAVKAVISRSIRRVGEVWGVGLYLHFVPTLHAVKRPPDYYEAKYRWSNKNLQIRWDPPQMPKEFIPRFMTPEQYVRMKRILPYFSEKNRKIASDTIADWEEDPDSVSYEDAEMTIGIIEDRIVKGLASIDNRVIVNPEVSKNKKKKNAESNTDANSGQSQSDQSQGASAAQGQSSNQPPKGSQADQGVVDVGRLYSMLVKINSMDKDHIWMPLDKKKTIKQAIVDHKNKGKAITTKNYESWIEQMQECLVALDDDLPF